jgi:hypothetical protein
VTEQDVGYIVWGCLAAIVVATEIMAWASKPWWQLPSIAATAADLQARWPWLATIILAGMAVLAVHLVFYPWPDLDLKPSELVP